MVKKIIALVLVLGVLGGIVAGCSGGGDTGPASSSDKAPTGANTGGGGTTA